MVIALSTVAFILWNSLQASSGSWAASNAVAELFAPVLNVMYAVANKVFALMGHPGILSYGVFVRKLAHFCEYLLLGAECCCITCVLTGKAASPYLWADMFIVLLMGVLDEYLQIFTGRTSSIADVLIDFAGGLTGIVIVLLVAFAVFDRIERAKSR